MKESRDQDGDWLGSPSRSVISEMADLSTSSLVSAERMLTVLSLTVTTMPTMPPLVVTLSPALRVLTRDSCCLVRLRCEEVVMTNMAMQPRISGMVIQNPGGWPVLPCARSPASEFEIIGPINRAAQSRQAKLFGKLNIVQRPTYNRWAMNLSSLTASALNRRMPSAVFSVAMASSFKSQRNF